jgi:hypothetical protein
MIYLHYRDGQVIERPDVILYGRTISMPALIVDPDRSPNDPPIFHLTQRQSFTRMAGDPDHFEQV